MAPYTLSERYTMTEMQVFDFGADGSFQIDQNRKEISVIVVHDDIFVRMDAGGGETCQMVFTKEQFKTFIEKCQGVEK